eukprot:GFUD01009137.1.p1 GENE.GFUD01009137.1~~GFUD01009137.1.p1  ORF type:complete len:626 (-),score=148.89 GFUD01009137.1:126-2003(-)
MATGEVRYDKGSSEEQLGISEFLNPNNPGFNGVIKERYSDFNVYEIDKSMEVVRLGNQDFPVEQTVDENLGYNSLTETQKSLFSEVQFARVKLFNSDPENNEDIEIDVTDLDKESRKEIHQILKGFPQVDSNTLEKDGKKFIAAKAKAAVLKSNKKQWPRERPKYLHFTLYKENMETYEAISLLANKCRTDEKHFGFAGTKDRRGRTTQKVSVSMVSAKQILGAARVMHKLQVGNFSYQKNELRLGDLGGNKFELGLRNVGIEEKDLKPVLDYFSETGFLNYFGTQRFGTMGVPTHLIGIKMISSNFSEAIDLILKPRDFENNFPLKEARRVWAESGDAQKALEILRKGRKDRTIEGKLFYGLSKRHKNDQVGALEEIPRQQRLLYCHAYQSYLWNMVVSKRIRTFGTRVIKGDLVYRRKEEMESEESDKQRPKEDYIEHVEDPDKYTIHDVLIPIPGCKVKFPENEVKDWFDELLAEDDLNLDSFVNSVKTYNLPGDYRNMVIKPWDVSWNIVGHDDPTEDLIKSDREVMEKSPEESANSENGTKTHKYRALVLNMSLPSSCYATMALREILRVETDKNSMIRLNNYKKDNPDEIPDITRDDLKRGGADALTEEQPIIKLLKVE